MYRLLIIQRLFISQFANKRLAISKFKPRPVLQGGVFAYIPLGQHLRCLHTGFKTDRDRPCMQALEHITDMNEG